MAKKHNTESLLFNSLKDYTYLYRYVEAMNAIVDKKGELYNKMKIEMPNIDEVVGGTVRLTDIHRFLMNKKIASVCGLSGLSSAELAKVSKQAFRLGAQNGRNQNLATTNDVDVYKAQFDKNLDDKFAQSLDIENENKYNYQQAKKERRRAFVKAHWAIMLTPLLALAGGLIGGLIFGVVPAIVAAASPIALFNIVGACGIFKKLKALRQDWKEERQQCAQIKNAYKIAKENVRDNRRMLKKYASLQNNPSFAYPGQEVNLFQTPHVASVQPRVAQEDGISVVPLAGGVLGAQQRQQGDLIGQINDENLGEQLSGEQSEVLTSQDGVLEDEDAVRRIRVTGAARVVDPYVRGVQKGKKEAAQVAEQQVEEIRADYEQKIGKAYDLIGDYLQEIAELREQQKSVAPEHIVVEETKNANNGDNTAVFTPIDWTMLEPLEGQRVYSDKSQTKQGDAQVKKTPRPMVWPKLDRTDVSVSDQPVHLGIGGLLSEEEIDSISDQLVHLGIEDLLSEEEIDSMFKGITEDGMTSNNENTDGVLSNGLSMSAIYDAYTDIGCRALEEVEKYLSYEEMVKLLNYMAKKGVNQDFVGWSHKYAPNKDKGEEPQQ